MRIGFRHGDPRFPFFWESRLQPPARWHDDGEGPVQYLSDTPDGAWAEFLRHEEISDATDLVGVSRRLWAIELPADVASAADVRVPRNVARGGMDSYPACRAEAQRLRARGATVLRAPSAALQTGCARGELTSGGLREAPDENGVVWVLVGTRPRLRGWAAVDAGAPTERLLSLVAHFTAAPAAPSGPDRRTASDRRTTGERRRLIDLTRDRDDERRTWPGDRRLIDRRG